MRIYSKAIAAVMAVAMLAPSAVLAKGSSASFRPASFKSSSFRSSAPRTSLNTSKPVSVPKATPKPAVTKSVPFWKTKSVPANGKAYKAPAFSGTTPMRSYNPFSGNFFFYMWLFGPKISVPATHVSSTKMVTATTTKATLGWWGRLWARGD